MPINRDVIYYDQWQTSINRWRVRLEIIPAGDVSTLPATYERLRRTCISIKGSKSSFKDLPLAAWQAPTMQVEIDLESCPDNLRLLLQDPVYQSFGTTPVTNRFTLYSDRGNAALDVEDWFIEFAGVQPISIGSKRTVNAKTLKPNRMTVECFDLGAIIMQEFTTSRFCGQVISDLSPVTSTKQLIDVETDNLLCLSDFTKTDGSKGIFHLYSLINAFNAWHYDLEWYDVPVWTRGNLGTDTVSTDGTPLDGVGFFEQDTAPGHAYGTALTDVLIIGLITSFYSTDAAERLGGMLIPNKGGAEYREYATVYDLLSDVAKCFWLKFRWTYGRYTQNTTNDNVSIRLHWNRRLDNYNAGVYYDVDITRAIGEISLENCYNVVRTGEAELPNVGDDDVDKRVVETGGLRNAATWNVKMLHYNQPGYAVELQGTDGDRALYRTDGATLRNLYYGSGSTVHKVHETVKIYDKSGVSTVYSDVISPENTSIKDYNKFVAQTQSGNTGLAYATAQHATSVFGKINQSKLEITLAMDATAGLLPCNVGEMYNLPTIDGEASSTEWTLLEAEPDWLTGSMKCTFISKGI